MHTSLAEMEKQVAREVNLRIFANSNRVSSLIQGYHAVIRESEKAIPPRKHNRRELTIKYKQITFFFPGRAFCGHVFTHIKVPLILNSTRVNSLRYSQPSSASFTQLKCSYLTLASSLPALLHPQPSPPPPTSLKVHASSSPPWRCSRTVSFVPQ